MVSFVLILKSSQQPPKACFTSTIAPCPFVLPDKAWVALVWMLCRMRAGSLVRVDVEALPDKAWLTSL